MNYFPLLMLTLILSIGVGWCLGHLFHKLTSRHLKKQIQLVAGAVYYQHNGDAKNPFLKEIDAPKVRVMEVKNGYVLYRYITTGNRLQHQTMPLSNFINTFALADEV